MAQRPVAVDKKCELRYTISVIQKNDAGPEGPESEKMDTVYVYFNGCQEGVIVSEEMVTLFL